MFRSILIIAIAAFLMGCKSKQKLNNTVVFHKDCKVANIPKPQLIQHYDTIGIDYKWLKIKTKINTEYKEEDLSFTANFRIKKDSLIYASITKAGIPFAKVLATKDSIKIIDLFHKKYKIGSFEELDSVLGFQLPFSILEKFLLAQPSFLYPENGFVKSDSISAIYSNLEKQSKTQLYQTTHFACDSIALRQTKVNSSGNELTIRYQNEEDINGFPLNKNITLEAKQDDKMIILADIEILRVKPFSKLKIPFSIPADYEALDSK